MINIINTSTKQFFNFFFFLILLNSTNRAYSVFERKIFDHASIKFLQAVKAAQSAALAPIEDPGLYLGFGFSSQKLGIIGALKDLRHAWRVLLGTIPLERGDLTLSEKTFVLESLDELSREFDLLIGIASVPSHGKIYKGLLKQAHIIEFLRSAQGNPRRYFQKILSKTYIKLTGGTALITAKLGDLERTIKIVRVMPVVILDLENWFNKLLNLRYSLYVPEEAFEKLKNYYICISVQLAISGYKNESMIFYQKAIIAAHILPALFKARRAILCENQSEAEKSLPEALQKLESLLSKARKELSSLEYSSSMNKEKLIESITKEILCLEKGIEIVMELIEKITEATSSEWITKQLIAFNTYDL